MAVSEKLLIEVGVKNEDSVKTARKEYAAFDENIKHLEKRLKSFLQTIDKTKLEKIKPAAPEDFKQLQENLEQTEKLLQSISVHDLSSFADSIEKSAEASEYFASKLKMSKKEVEELNKIVALGIRTQSNASAKSIVYTDIYNFIATSKDQATALALVSATIEEQSLIYEQAEKESKSFASSLIKLGITFLGLYQAFHSFKEISKYIYSFNNNLQETRKSLLKFFNDASVGAQRVGLLQRVLNSFPGIVSDIKNAKISETLIAPFVSAFSKIEAFSKAGMSKISEIFSLGTNQIAKNVGATAAGVATSISRNAILISEVAAVSQIPLLLFGQAALTSDSAILKLVGTISIFAAILAGGFATAVVFALSKVGQFVEMIGDTLINAMQKMSDKFIKTQSIMSQFSFVIEGYGRTIGEKAVGSLELWQNKIEEITRATTFSTDEVAKAIKLLVAEGSVLGLSLTQNVDLLARATDVASAQGRELSDVVLALASGLMGQSQSVLSLGINLKEVHLEHSKFLVNQNKLLSDLSESEKVQLRYNEVMKQTAPIVGAAANELNTIAGSTKKVQQEFELLQIKLGAINEITRAFVLLKQKLLSTFVNLPDPILSAIGILIDFGGVFLKLSGVIIKYALVISGLAIIYKGLYWITTQNVLAQGILTASMSVLGNAVGVQTVAVVSLSTAWSNLLLIMRGGLVVAAKTLMTVFAGLAKAIIGFSVALLANPLTWVIAAATAVIFNFIDAANDIRKELSFLRNAFDSVGIGFSLFGDTFSGVIKVLKVGWQILYSSAKVALLGIIEIILVVRIAFLKLKAAFASTKEEQDKYNLAIDELVKNFKETDRLVKKTVDNMGISFGGVAHAANLVGESMDEVAEKTRIYALRAKKLVEVIGEVSQEAVKIGVFGTEFDRATLAIKQNKDELNKLTSAFVENGAENKESLDQIRTKTEELWRSEFELQKLRNSTIEDFTQKSRQLEIDRLRASGNVVQAIKMEFDAQKRLIDEQVAGLEKTGPLTDDQIARIKELKSAIEQAEKAAKLSEIRKKAKEQIQNIDEIRKKNIELQYQIESDKLGEVELIDKILEKNLRNIDEMREKNKIQGTYTKELEKELQLGAKLNKQKAEQDKEKIGKVDIIPKSTIDALRAGVGEGAANFAAGISEGLASFVGSVGAIMSAVNGVLDFAQQLIDFIPQVLNKITNIFNSLTDLPLKIMEGIQNVFASIGNFVRNFIPNIITAVEGILDAIVAFVFDIPQMVRDLLDKIPEMLIKLLNRLPEIIENLIIGLIVAMPEIVNALVEFLILRAPEIAMKMAEVLAIKLPIAIANGLARAVKKVFGNFINSLGRVFGFNVRKETENLGKQIADGAKKAVKDISRETSQLFSVKNLEEAAKGLTENQAIQDALDNAKTFWQYLMERLNALVMFFVESWQRFVSALDQVWKGVITALNMAWGMIKTIFDGIIKGLKDAFNWGAEAIKKAANYLYELGGKIWDGFKDALSKGMDFFSNIGNKIVEGLKKALDQLSPGNLIEKLFGSDGKGKKGPVEKALSIDVPFVSFAQGGLVPGSAMVPGDSALNDRILALLSPGEYVIPRSAMDMPGVKQLVEAVAKGKYEPQKFFKAGPVKIGGYVGERIEAARSGGVSGAVDQASDLGKKIESGGAQAWTEIQNAGQDVLDTLAQMDPAKLWKMVEEKVWDGIWAMITNSAPAFHSGGLVPAFANGGEVMAKLQPGEYVMQRSAVQQNGLGLLNRMNNGQAQSSNQTYNIDLNVQIDASAQSLDETFVRNKLIPSIKSELKKSSLRGEFVLSDRGLR